MKKFNLIKCLFSLALLPTSNYGFAGGDASGGGDTCEDRIQVIRDDIQTWVHKGGGQNLKLPDNIEPDEYASRMLDAIEKTKPKIRCLGPGDKGYPVEEKGVPKVCRFYSTGLLSRFRGTYIDCDFKKFLDLNESDQYVLVHHEYAGVAGLEVSDDGRSEYPISNQISSQLEDQVVKRLVVQAVTYPDPSSLIGEFIGTDALKRPCRISVVSYGEWVDFIIRDFNNHFVSYKYATLPEIENQIKEDTDWRRKKDKHFSADNISFALYRATGPATPFGQPQESIYANWYKGKLSVFSIEPSSSGPFHEPGSMEGLSCFLPSI